MIYFIYAGLTLLGLFLLFSLFVYASVLVISAAPFCLAVLFSFTSVKYNHWALFAFLIIVLYSLASYPKIRKAVTFVSISIMGAFLCSLITMFFSKQLPDSKFLLAIIRLLMLIVCIVMSMRFDAEKVNPFCINIARYIKLPILIQRLISSVICGIGVFFMVTITFIDFFKTPFMQNVVGIIS